MSELTTNTVLLAYENSFKLLDLDTGVVSGLTVYYAEPPFDMEYPIPSGGGLWVKAEPGGGTWFMSNGKCLVFCNHTGAANRILGTQISVSAVAENASRLYLGGVSTYWFQTPYWADVFAHWQAMQASSSTVHDDMGAPNNMVFWSGLGGDSQDHPYLLFLTMLGVFGTYMFEELRADILAAVESGVIGMRPMTTTGPVVALAGHGDRMNVYGQRGIAALVQDAQGAWGEIPVLGMGIKGRGAVAGTKTRHVFADTYGTLWLYQLGEGVRRLGYEQILAIQDPKKTIISHDPELDEYWISDGITTYLLTPNGMGGPITTAPSGLVRDQKHRLIGAVTNASDGNKHVKLTTNAHNMGVQDMKHIGLVQFSMYGIGGGDTPLASTPVCWIEWQDSDGTFKAGFSDPVNSDGVSFPHTSFRDARVAMEGWAENEDARIWGVQLRYNAEGKTYIRGTIPTKLENADE